MFWSINTEFDWVRKEINNVSKKLLICLIGCMVTLSLIGCSSKPPVQVNVSNSESIHSNQFAQFVDIGEDLIYDSATRIVYVEFYTYGGHYGRCPYYAPNGLPYRYNPETNTFEEINYK